MKKLYKNLFIPLAFLFIPFSCNREMLSSLEDMDDAKDNGLIQAFVEKADTKGHVDADTGEFTWREGDKIAVWTEENGYITGDIKSGSETSTATFAVPLHGATRSGYAIYPESAAYEGAPGTEGDPLAISLPTVRRIDNSKANWNNLVEVPMVAVNQPGQDLQFKYTCAMVRLTLKNVPNTTRFIRVQASRSISGYFAVDTTEPSAPTISSDNTQGAGNLSYMVFQFKNNVSGTVTVNLPVPGGVRYNLVVSTHTWEIHSGVVDALRPGAASSRGTSRFSIGEQRNFERGKGYVYELDCSTGVSYAMDTFTVPSETLYEAETKDLSWSILRNNAGNQLVTISGLTISSYVEDPTIAHVQVIDRDRLYYDESATYRPIIRVKGLLAGSTKLVTTAVRGNDVLTVVSNITVRKRGYHVYFRAADKVLTGGCTPLTAYFRRDGFETTADAYEWIITEGADLATIEDSTGPQYKWLRAGDREGTVTLICKTTFDGIVSTSQPVSIRIMKDAPTGAVRGLFTIDAAFNNVFFSAGNLLWEKDGGKYMFFDTQIGYYLLRYRPSGGRPYTQIMADLFNENEIPENWFYYPMNQSRVYSDFDSEDFTTGWYGLRYIEWEYLLYNRRGVPLNGVADARYGRCSVKDEAGTNIRCIMLFPDGYVHPDGIPFPGSINVQNDVASSYTKTVYTMEQMQSLQDVGVVFLPITGYYQSNNGYNAAYTGALYWTSDVGVNSSKSSGGRALGLHDGSGTKITNWSFTNSNFDYYFFSIRLVRND